MPADVDAFEYLLKQERAQKVGLADYNQLNSNDISGKTPPKQYLYLHPNSLLRLQKNR